MSEGEGSCGEGWGPQRWLHADLPLSPPPPGACCSPSRRPWRRGEGYAWRRGQPEGRPHLTPPFPPLPPQEPDHPASLGTAGAGGGELERGGHSAVEGAAFTRGPADSWDAPPPRSWTPQTMPWEPSSGPRWGRAHMSPQLRPLCPAPQVRPSSGTGKQVRAEGVGGKAGLEFALGLCLQEPHPALSRAPTAPRLSPPPGPP